MKTHGDLVSARLNIAQPSQRRAEGLPPPPNCPETSVPVSMVLFWSLGSCEKLHPLTLKITVWQ